MSAAYLSVKSINKSPNHPRVAMRHNFREIAAELGADSHINPRRIKLNQVIYGLNDSAGVELLRLAELKRLNIKPRKNALHAIEILVGISNDAPINQLAFFLAARDWLKSKYGGMMIHAVIHNDEEHPHMHALILPIVEKRLQGNVLKGNRNRFVQLQADFYHEVCAPFGLSKPKPSSRSSEKSAAQAVIEAIERTPEIWVQDDFQAVVKSCVYKNPIVFFKCVGFEPNREVSELTKIMTKKVRQEKPVKLPQNNKPLSLCSGLQKMVI